MIEANHLTKKYRKKTAVDDVSFRVELGKVTGFLGPNGAGKSTTMRLMLGLDKGEGKTTYDGKLLSEYEDPSRVVGILLEAKAFHPTRSARNHLKVLAAAGGIPEARVDEVLDIVGLKQVAKKGPSKFSLGMSQRLGIAAALLGDPKYLLLDEPANGLDPEGIAWLRQFIVDYTKKDRAVLISSHLLSEMSQMADNIVVIAKGRLIASSPTKQLINKAASSTFVRTTKTSELEKALRKAKYAYEKQGNGFVVPKVSTDDIGKLAFANKLTILELAQHRASLEEVFFDLTEGREEYQARGGKE